MYLRHDSYRVDVCASGSDGLEAARREHPDLVVLDVRLPGLSGTEICRALREGPSQVPIIMLTARSTEEDEMRIGGWGASRPMVDIVDQFPIANVGSRFLSQYAVTFDLGNSRLAWRNGAKARSGKASGIVQRTPRRLRRAACGGTCNSSP